MYTGLTARVKFTGAVVLEPMWHQKPLRAPPDSSRITRVYLAKASIRYRNLGTVRNYRQAVASKVLARLERSEIRVEKRFHYRGAR